MRTSERTLTRWRRCAAGGAAGLLLLLLLLLVGTWSTPTSGQASARPARPGLSSAAGPHVLTITAMDYAFRVPPAVPPGLTTVRLVNQGAHLHHVQIVRLDQGKTVGDLVREWKGGAPSPAYVVGEGGPTVALGGQTLEGQLVLQPGRYGVVCWLTAPDGQLHVHKGMFGEFEVRRGAAPLAALPTPDATVVMTDYGYLVPPIRRGRRVIRVQNKGPQAHELVLMRLHPGMSLRDVAAWARDPARPAPGVPIGGVAGLSPGRTGQFTGDFTPGEYVLLCFMPDQRDGRGHPHTTYGMIRQFRVS